MQSSNPRGGGGGAGSGAEWGRNRALAGALGVRVFASSGRRAHLVAFEGNQELVLLPLEICKMVVQLLCTELFALVPLRAALLQVRDHELLLAQLALARVGLDLRRAEENEEVSRAGGES